MLDDKKLIKACAKGERKAQRMLFDKYSPKMLVICKRYFTNKHSSEDAMIEGFTKIFRNISSYKHTGSFESWMIRLMINTSIDMLRANKKFRFDVDIDDCENFIKQKSYDVNEGTTEDLMKLIQELPVGCRTVFNLYELEGYKHQEIAEMLEIAESTSKSQLLRVRKRLKDKIIS